jgi:2-polyprenyl-3-methyl-5-hydroxy-6-metoxy-1,4-benzoquinol methylase
MSTPILEQLFFFLQNLVFKQIGGKIRTNDLKSIMDFVFILVEKIGCKFEVISEIYLKLYEDIVTKEITLAQISQKDRILVIGSGSLPVTPTLIVRNTHAQTVSIDIDPHAVKQAIHYVNSQNLEQLLKIEYADGFTYPIEQFNVIIVLYGVKHPAEMLRNLADRIDQNTKVIYRTITDTKGKILDKTLDLSQYFIIKEQVHTETLGSFDSFLIMKK